MNIKALKEKIPLTTALPFFYPQGKIFKVGSNRWRCNPAPCCGHNDAFTFADASSHCFSCGYFGDVLDLVKLILGVETREGVSILEKAFAFKRPDKSTLPNGKSSGQWS